MASFLYNHLIAKINAFMVRIFTSFKKIKTSFILAVKVIYEVLPGNTYRSLPCLKISQGKLIWQPHRERTYMRFCSSSPTGKAHMWCFLFIILKCYIHSSPVQIFSGKLWSLFPSFSSIAYTLYSTKRKFPHHDLWNLLVILLVKYLRISLAK